MDSYFLPDHIRVCRTLFDLVALDLKRNRYFCLGERESEALHALGISPPHPATTATPEQPAILTPQLRSLLDGLVAAQLLGRGTCTPIGQTVTRFAHVGTLASAGYEHDECAAIRPHHIAHLLYAWAWAHHALRTGSLYKVSRQVRRARLQADRTDTPFDPTRAIPLVGAFRTLRPFLYGARERCLLHALVLTRFLAFYSVHPFWVIGVRTRPWAAHSWVQWGSLILDARPDDVCEYTPILIA